MSEQPTAYFTRLSAGTAKPLRGGRGISIRLVDEDLGPAANVDVHVNTLHVGSGPGPVHYHERAENIYIVLEGEIEVRVGADLHRLGPDDVVLIPPGVPHATSNPGTVPARFIELYAPSGPDFHIVAQGSEA